MSRRDYELIARVLRESRVVISPGPKGRLAQEFAAALKDSNSGFKMERFMRAVMH